jgi:hypothetical protein
MRTEPSGLRPFTSLRLELRSLGERITCAATTERAMVPFREYLSAFPLVAILRGLRPEDAAAIGEALVEGGFRIIEVPLNSPEPLRSIEMLAKRFGPEVLVGAGTVLDPADVGRVRDAGGRLVVMPHGDAAVIARRSSRRRRCCCRSAASIPTTWRLMSAPTASASARPCSWPARRRRRCATTPAASRSPGS